MTIELLYFDGCPSYRALLPKLRELLDREGVEDEIELRQVESLEAAEQERFLGSPTVRVNGEDVDPPRPRRSSSQPQTRDPIVTGVVADSIAGRSYIASVGLADV